ncbi:MAG TPA: hypothetical protein VH482_08995 [Thermomicrobiales bacterium]|jgi:hypothetical protein
MISRNQIEAARLRRDDFLVLTDRHRFVVAARRPSGSGISASRSIGTVCTVVRVAVTALATAGLVARPG